MRSSILLAPAPAGLALAALLFLAPARAAAQEPAAEPTAAEADADRWRVLVDFGLTAASGNQQLTVLTTGFRLSHLRTDAFELEWTGQVRYGRSEGRDVARNLRSGVQADFVPQADWSPFLFVSAERDPFRRLDLRANGGAGVKRVLVRSARTGLSISAAALYSRDDLRPEPDSPALPVEQTARWSWRVKGHHDLAEGVRLESVAFYQPVWNRAGDYLIDLDSSVRVRLTARLALTVTHTFDRDSNPPEGIRPDDHLLKVGLAVEL